MSVTNIINERGISNSGSNLDVFGDNQTIDIITNTVNERIELEERLGDELVQNGNFSELGSELILNPNFNDNSFWSVEADVTIANNKVNFNTSQTNYGIYKTSLLTSNKTYKVQFEITDYTSGGVHFNIGGVAIGNYTALGTHTEYVSSSGTNVFAIQSDNGGAVLSIDNVSVKEVDHNDIWNLETGWSYGDNRLNFTTGGSSNRACSSNASITNGKTYKLSFNVLSISSGQVSLRFGGMAGVNEITATSTGIHSGIITANSSANGNVQIEDNDNNFVGSITDVSVAEVNVDREAFTNETDQHNSTVTNIVNERIELEERLGSELVTNGDFATDSDWGKGSGWTISGSRANRSGESGNSPITQNVPVVNGKKYTFSYTRKYLSGSGSTNIFVKLDNVNYSTIGAYISTVVEEHTVTGEFTAGFTGDLLLQIYGIGDFTGYVDNVTIKEIGADREAFTNESQQHNSTVTNIVNERTV